MYAAPIETYHAPDSLSDALAVLAAQPSRTRALAGRQSAVPPLRARDDRPAILVDLRRVPGLGDLAIDPDGTLPVGALVRCRELAVAEPGPGWEALADAATAIGDRQVRNRGTLGGNLAHADVTAFLGGAPVVVDEHREDPVVGDFDHLDHAVRSGASAGRVPARGARRPRRCATPSRSIRPPRSSPGSRRTLRTRLGLLTDRQRTRLETVFAFEEHVAVEVTWWAHQQIIAAYEDHDRHRGRTLLATVIDRLRSGLPAGLEELATLGRPLHRRRDDVLAFFTHRASNGPTDAINGRLEALRRNALGVRNLVNYRIRSLLPLVPEGKSWHFRTTGGI